jgi:hypothetical protein
MAEAPLERHCGACAFFRAGQREGIGQCHRFPPPVPQLDYFPMVSASSFCGEYERA